MSKDKGVAASNAPQAQAWYGDLKILSPSERLKQAILLEAREEVSDAQFGAKFRAHYTELPAPTLQPGLKNQILNFAQHEVGYSSNVVQLSATKKTANKLQVILSIAAGFVVLGAISVVLVYMPAAFRGEAEDSQTFPEIQMRALEQRRHAERAKLEMRSRAATLEKQRSETVGTSDRSGMPPGQSSKPFLEPLLLADQWLEVIRQLAAKGQRAEALESFRKFKLSYPHHPTTLKDDWK